MVGDEVFEAEDFGAGDRLELAAYIYNKIRYCDLRPSFTLSGYCGLSTIKCIPVVVMHSHLYS